MLNIKWIRENQELFDEKLSQRFIEPMSSKIAMLDGEKRKITSLIQEFQHARKVKSKILGNMASKSGEEFEGLQSDVKHINEKLEELEQDLNNNNELNELLNMLPNIPDEEVPYGIDESMNKLVRTHGEINPNALNKQHFELGTKLNLMDFEQTAKISGARFVTLKGDLAKLERALINFMIDVHTKEFDFFEISPPVLVRD
ncbi:MAG TPA: serine--tRNA ligase, partial [Rickettsia endosymbiont of Omalisus fontisbellaquei]|nr:serine--tRNA ligase [Rickettsia endosymbiont of Omalisus fontisbellaquei]